MNDHVYSYPKNPPFRSKKYRAWISRQPCVKCNLPAGTGIDIVPAHQDIYGKGTALKVDDTQCLPLCVICHDREHHGKERFWGNTNCEMMIIQHLTRYLRGLENE